MSATTNRKIGKLYEGLNERERVRMMAKLSREHKPDELARLRDATPPEHAAAYNRALGMLRAISGIVSAWITAASFAMDANTFALTAAIRDTARDWQERRRLIEAWKLTPYPVTESEYRAIVQRERAELYPLAEYPERLIEWGHPHLNPAVAAYLAEDPKPGEDDSSTATYAGVIAIIEAAIKRGELPKPKRSKGERSLPLGVLADWGEGTTQATYEPAPPGFAVPAIEELFAGGMNAKWDIRPDAEAELVKERREELRDIFLLLSGAPRTEWEQLASLDPPLTEAEYTRASKQASELYERWFQSTREAEIAAAAAIRHAGEVAELESIAGALAVIQQEDFYGEDPLWPETRAKLEATKAKAKTFAELWTMAGESGLSWRVHRALGREISVLEAIEEPPPLPTAEPEPGEMLRIIREWAEMF